MVEQHSLPDAVELVQQFPDGQVHTRTGAVRGVCAVTVDGRELLATAGEPELISAAGPHRDVQDFAGHADPRTTRATTAPGTTSTGTPPYVLASRLGCGADHRTDEGHHREQEHR